MSKVKGCFLAPRERCGLVSCSRSSWPFAAARRVWDRAVRPEGRTTARLTHPVPQVADLLPSNYPTFSGDIRSWARCPIGVSNGGFHNPASPFATHRLLWVSFPAFRRYYGDAKTASVLLLRLRFSLCARYLGSLSVFFTRRPKVRRQARILFYRFDPSRCSFPWRQEALPASPKTPVLLCAALRPRADFRARPLRRFRVAPATQTTKAPPFYFLSRLYHTALQLAAYA